MLMKKLLAFLLACVGLFGLTACNCGGTADSGHKHEYTETVVAPTCLNQGYTIFTCECGKSYKDNYTDPLGHDFVENVCTRCGYFKHNHEYDVTVISPTCTEKGYTQGKCRYCAASYTTDFIDPLGHNYVNGKCTRCGAIYHDHTYKKTVTEPTCTQQGYTVYRCDCGDNYKDDYTEPLGHNYVDGKCTRCDDFYTTELLYTLSDDGTYYICNGISKTNNSIGEVRIPSTYESKPVKAIADEAFRYKSGLKSIKIPDSVTHIGKQAFYSCRDLIDVNFGNGVTYIGQEAFAYCKALKNIIIPDNVINIGSWAFAICDGLKSVKLPSGITSISEYAFYKCYNLTEITIPQGVASIGKKAFGSCSKLVNADIPESVTYIGDYAFEVCQELSGIIYGGTIAQWSAIIKGNNWDQNCGLLYGGSYTVNCTDGTYNKGDIPFY